MKEILETIIESLISDKASATVTEIASEKEIKYEVRVTAGDMGRVIGKNGKIAKSIRTLMRAVASKENKKIVIEFVD